MLISNHFLHHSTSGSECITKAKPYHPDPLLPHVDCKYQRQGVIYLRFFSLSFPSRQGFCKFPCPNQIHVDWGCVWKISSSLIIGRDKSWTGMQVRGQITRINSDWLGSASKYSEVLGLTSKFSEDIKNMTYLKPHPVLACISCNNNLERWTSDARSCDLPFCYTCSSMLPRFSILVPSFQMQLTIPSPRRCFSHAMFPVQFSPRPTFFFFLHSLF